MDLFDAVVVHYSEIALKGANRRVFEEALAENARAALADVGAEVTRVSGRLLVRVPPGSAGAAIERLRTVFGVAWLSQCRLTEPNAASLREAAVEVARECPGGGSFRVEASRADKSFPLTSMQINRELGAAIAGELGLRVDLENPDLLVRVEVLRDVALVCCNRVRGPGGLPVGTMGSAVALISGGIDSPVAAWLVAKRGVRVDLLHLYPFDEYDEGKLDKIVRLARALTVYTMRTRLLAVPCWPFRFRITRREGRYASLLLRLFSMRLAARLAADRGYLAVVTGDSLGQVASQTLHNIAATYSNAGITVLAPLIGMDKEEIVRAATSIGTYGVSIERYPDCCPAVVRGHPVTRTSPRVLLELYEGAGLDGAVEEALYSMREMEFERRGSEVVRAG
ncbi:MAG: tRNA uracil 4-sulfurtransferase ThiI [Conexivisphaera sp.]